MCSINTNYKLVLSKMKCVIVNFYVILPCIYLQTNIIQQMHFVLQHTWHTSIPTCFGTEMPSSGSDYNTGAQTNLPIYWQAGRLSSLRTGRLCSLDYFLWVNAAWRNMSMKNSNCTIGNRSRYLPACSAVPQATASSRVPLYRQLAIKTYFFKVHNRSRSIGDVAILPAVIQESNGPRNWMISNLMCGWPCIVIHCG